MPCAESLASALRRSRTTRPCSGFENRLSGVARCARQGSASAHRRISTWHPQRTAKPVRGSSHWTLPWRKTDSNSWSHRERNGCERAGGRHLGLGPDLNLTGFGFRAGVLDGRPAAEPFAGAGPAVRIRFAPAESQQTFGPSRDRGGPRGPGRPRRYRAEIRIGHQTSMRRLKTPS